MKIELDARDIDETGKNLARREPFFAIRLYPESNDEMARLEWALAEKMRPVEIQRIVLAGSIQYAVQFKAPKT